MAAMSVKARLGQLLFSRKLRWTWTTKGERALRRGGGGFFVGLWNWEIS